MRENLRLAVEKAGTDASGTISRIEAQRTFGEISRRYLDALVRHRSSMFRLNTDVGRRVFR